MKQFFSLLCLLFVGLTASAQHVEVLDFKLSDFVIENAERMVSIHTASPDYVLHGDTKSPAIPYLIYKCDLKKGEKFGTYTVTYEKELVAEDVLLECVPQAYPTSQTAFVDIDKKEYTKESVLNPISVASEQISRGRHFVSFLITPFLYDAFAKELYFVKSITLQVETEAIPESEIENHDDLQFINDESAGGVILSQAQDFAFNPSFPPIQPLTPAEQYPADYIIITSAELSSAFKPLADWKTQKGVRTRILTTSYIDQKYTGSTPQLRIKNCLYDYYQKSNLKYALFGGGVAIVPSQMCYISASGLVDVTPCDLYYACFDNQFDWDANQNGIYGEVADNIDLVPDIYISRLLANDSLQVAAIIAKLLHYEKNPPTTNYANKLFLTGIDLRTGTNHKPDVSLLGQEMFVGYIAPYWNGGNNYSYLYNDIQNVSASNDYPCTGINLSEQLNTGYHIVHEYSHGWYDTWELQNDCHYTTFHAAQQTNPSPSIILTAACMTNAFDLDSCCLSQTFIANPNGGAAAYWGFSREGWMSPSSDFLSGHWGMQFNANIIKNLYLGDSNTQTFNLGTAIKNSRETLSSNCLSNSINRWMYLCSNLIGDPEMPVYTDDPQQMPSPTITSPTRTSLTINTNGIEDCDITLTNYIGELLSGRHIFKTAKGVSSYTFTGITTPVRVVVTKHNYIPYVSDPICPEGLMYIDGDDFVCDSTLYYLRGIPSLSAGDSVNVEWSYSHLGSTYPYIQHTYNTSCVVANPNKKLCSGTLTATVKYHGETIAVVPRVIYGDSLGFSGTYQTRTVYNLPYEGTLLPGYPAYVAANYPVQLLSTNFNGRTITYSSAITPTNFVHMGSVVYLELPGGSPNEPFYIYAEGEGTCNNYGFVLYTRDYNQSPSPNAELQVSFTNNQIIATADAVEEPWDMEICNIITGEKVYSQKNITEVSHKVSTLLFNPGTYLVRLIQKEKVITEKIIVK